jgi:EamA domain-containing membrane protein RarD
MLAGVLSAGCAFLMWGVFPLYLKTLKAIPPLEILSHRVFWSLDYEHQKKSTYHRSLYCKRKHAGN